jgi:hypothetical protein
MGGVSLFEAGRNGGGKGIEGWLDTYDFDVSQNVFNNYAASMS